MLSLRFSKSQYFDWTFLFSIRHTCYVNTSMNISFPKHSLNKELWATRIYLRAIFLQIDICGIQQKSLFKEFVTFETNKYQATYYEFSISFKIENAKWRASKVNIYFKIQKSFIYIDRYWYCLNLHIARTCLEYVDEKVMLPIF